MTTKCIMIIRESLWSATYREGRRKWEYKKRIIEGKQLRRKEKMKRKEAISEGHPDRKARLKRYK